MVYYEEELNELYENGEITIDRYCEIMDVIYEKSDKEKQSKPPKTRAGFLKRLRDIRKVKPSEYDGPEEIKEFVDTHYDSILKASEFIEKEPHRLRRNNIISIAVTVILIISGIAWLLSGGAAASIVASQISLLLPIIGVINQTIHSIIHYLRSSKDTTIINNLSKIKKALKKIDTKPLPETYKKKISLMIDAIEDAETDGIDRVKMTNEASEDIKTIYQRYMDSEITYTERDEMIEFINSPVY